MNKMWLSTNNLKLSLNVLCSIFVRLLKCMRVFRVGPWCRLGGRQKRGKSLGEGNIYASSLEDEKCLAALSFEKGSRYSLLTPPGQALSPLSTPTSAPTPPSKWNTRQKNNPACGSSYFQDWTCAACGCRYHLGVTILAWNAGSKAPVCLTDISFLSSANSESSRVPTQNFKNCLLIIVVMLRIQKSSKTSLLMKSHWTSKTDRCFLFNDLRCQKILWSRHLGIKIFPSIIEVFVCPNL